MKWKFNVEEMRDRQAFPEFDSQEMLYSFDTNVRIIWSYIFQKSFFFLEKYWPKKTTFSLE